MTAESTTRQIGAAKIDVDHPFPIRQFLIHGAGDGLGKAGIINKNVKLTEASDRIGNHGIDASLGRNVRNERNRIVRQFRDRGLEARSIAIGNHHTRAVSSQSSGDRQSDAAGRAGDKAYCSI
jgi:hypothetical protein